MEPKADILGRYVLCLGMSSLPLKGGALGVSTGLGLQQIAANA